MNSEEKKARDRGYYYANRDRRLRMAKEWRERNPDKVKGYRKRADATRNRRALKKIDMARDLLSDAANLLHVNKDADGNCELVFILMMLRSIVEKRR